MKRGFLAGRFAALTLMFAVLGMVLAGHAPAATETVPVKVVLTEIIGDDLVGFLKSKSARCVKNRRVALSGDSSEIVQTNTDGGFGFGEGNLYQVGSWTVTVERSKRFGRPGKRKRCGADSASYDYVDRGPATITFSYAPGSGGSGTVSWSDPGCIGSQVLLDHNGIINSASTDLVDGSYSFAESDFAEPGAYKVIGPSSVYLTPRPNGNLDAGKCYGESPTVNVAR